MLNVVSGFPVLIEMQPAGSIRPRHKFYFPDKAKIITDDSEVTTKAIVGDKESEGRYTILSDLWKVGFNVPPHYHAKHFETFIYYRVRRSGP